MKCNFWHSKICSVVQLKISSFVQTLQYIPARPKEEKPLVKKIMQPIGPESNLYILRITGLIMKIILHSNVGCFKFHS